MLTAMVCGVVAEGMGAMAVGEAAGVVTAAEINGDTVIAGGEAGGMARQAASNARTTIINVNLRVTFHLPPQDLT